MESWQVTQKKVDEAIRRIVAASRPRAVILFGSYVRGEIGANSDLDVLVVVDDSVSNCRQESVRIRKELKGISMPMDILVVRNGDFLKLSSVENLIYKTALQEGQTVYEQAA